MALEIPSKYSYQKATFTDPNFDQPSMGIKLRFSRAEPIRINERIYAMFLRLMPAAPLFIIGNTHLSQALLFELLRKIWLTFLQVSFNISNRTSQSGDFSHREHRTDSIRELMTHFLSEIQTQINEKHIPNYFNHEINLFQTTEPYTHWFEHITQCLNDRLPMPASFFITSNRPIIVEFLFHFIDQLYQTFHIKRSQFHLNEAVLLDLHQQLCEKLSNDANNNSTSLQKFINHLLDNQQILDHIQTNLTDDFESNAELVHTCLNQVRKADSSLIFHYTWTIYIQYLHTYYNVLWNI